MDLQVCLTRKQIADALPKLAEGLSKYLCIQAAVSGGIDISKDRRLQKAFNGFYRVRRGKKWQKIYFELLAREACSITNTNNLFAKALNYISEKTGRVEASFASKLVATVDPKQPVIDSVVLRNVGGRLPYPYKKNRLQEIVSLHKNLSVSFREYLATADGKHLVASFKKTHPNSSITEIKMLDLVLWQTRKPRRSHKKGNAV